MKELMRALEGRGACEPAIEYLEMRESLEEAWRMCHRHDWMIWLLREVGKSVRVWEWTLSLYSELTMPNSSTPLYLQNDEIVDTALAFIRRVEIVLEDYPWDEKRTIAASLDKIDHIPTRLLLESMMCARRGDGPLATIRREMLRNFYGHTQMSNVLVASLRAFVSGEELADIKQSLLEP